MKAAICIKHGDPGGIKIKEVQKPPVKKNELLVKIFATTVIPGDVMLRKQSFLQYLIIWPFARLYFGVKNQRKKILGHEFSGVIDSVGEGVSRFKKGDAVFGTTGFKGGAHAEYLSCPEGSIVALKPENLSFEEAATLPIGGISALDLLKKVNIQSGEEVLIYGASGSIGTYAVQLAKHFGAVVTGVCSAANIELVRILGADIVLDYTKNDFAERKEKYDLVFDTVGKFPKPKAKKVLSEKGRYVSTHTSPVKEKQEYLNLLHTLASKNIVKPIIDKTYSLEEIKDAHAYVETRRKKGNVVITLKTQK